MKADLSIVVGALVVGAGLVPSLKAANAKALQTFGDARSIGDEHSRGGPVLHCSPYLLYAHPLRLRDVEDCAGRLLDAPLAGGLERAEFEALIAATPPRTSAIAVDATWTALSGGSSYVSAEEIERQLQRWRPGPAIFVLAEYERSLLQGRATTALGYVTLFGLQLLALWVFALQPVADALRLRGGAALAVMAGINFFDVQPPPITPATGAAWQSVALNGATAATEPSLAAKSLSVGTSVLIVPNVATDAECDFLVGVCSQAALEHAGKGVWWNGVWFNVTGLVRLPSLDAAARTAAAETVFDRTTAGEPPRQTTLVMPSAADAVCEAILLRLLAAVDAELPTIAQLQFGATAPDASPLGEMAGSASPLADMYAADELAFAEREPAINVYAAGGEFAPHKDNQAFTMLVPLSSPEGFEGGGTGFWCESAAQEMSATLLASKEAESSAAASAADRLEHLSASPTMVLKPARGTAMLWSGDVLHSGVRLESGSRLVFVASFSSRGGGHGVHG